MDTHQTGTVLDRIVALKHQRLLARHALEPLAVWQERLSLADSAGRLRPNGDFAAALHRPAGPAIIAEIKKASPSHGLIQPDFDPAGRALAYAAAGVQAISVLTEEDYFQGSDQDFLKVGAAVSLPLLRKDFIIEPAQIYESRWLGASAVLLIAALLDSRTLESFLELAHDLGLAALVEVHDQNELDRTLAGDAQIIGINNRDLRTLAIDLGTTERLAARIPPNRTIVSESGIMTADDLARVCRAGVHAVLIGETLMRTDGTDVSIGYRLQQLQGLAR
jgi:indole-3-glycerol phosphate synthase